MKNFLPRGALRAIHVEIWYIFRVHMFTSISWSQKGSLSTTITQHLLHPFSKTIWSIVKSKILYDSQARVECLLADVTVKYPITNPCFFCHGQQLVVCQMPEGLEGCKIPQKGYKKWGLTLFRGGLWTSHSGEVM